MNPRTVRAALFGALLLPGVGVAEPGEARVLEGAVRRDADVALHAYRRMPGQTRASTGEP